MLTVYDLDMSHRLRNSVNFRLFSGDQIGTLLILYFDLFPKAFFRKKRKLGRQKRKK